MDDGMWNEREVLMIFLDIANAFNSLPWPVIHSALEAKEVPEYLRGVIEDYLSDRYLTYTDRENSFVRSPMTCDVS